MHMSVSESDSEVLSDGYQQVNKRADVLSIEHEAAADANDVFNAANDAFNATSTVTSDVKAEVIASANAKHKTPHSSLSGKASFRLDAGLCSGLRQC